jgi:putative peptidoglycan lipid II flippase
MAAVTLPVSAALVALSRPVMNVLAFGEASEGDGPRLLAAALVGLGLGVLPYGGFLLLARAFYSLGDSRTPAVAALGSSVVGATVMALSGALDGPVRLAGLGAGHSVAFLLGAVWLVQRLRPIVGSVGLAGIVRPLAVSVLVGLAAWLVMDAWSPSGRVETVVALAVVGAAGALLYVATLRLINGLPGPAPALERAG